MKKMLVLLGLFTSMVVLCSCSGENVENNGASEEEISKIQHKLCYKYVKGGVILADTDFTIK